MVPHILFDLDGTLTDPFEGITGSVQYALEKLGIQAPPKDELKHFIGPPLSASFRRYYGMNEETAAQAVTFYREYFGTKGIFENALLPGAAELLQTLTAKGKKVYLATSKPQFYALQILQHFGIHEYFSGVTGSPMDAHGSTKDVIVRQALAIGGITPAQAVMVGDRKEDILGAKANNVTSIGVLVGYGSREELENAGANYIAATMAELSALLCATPAL